ncbi:MAG: TonB-dependent siderophore receptor [Opitutaceae bacterium]
MRTPRLATALFALIAASAQAQTTPARPAAAAEAAVQLSVFEVTTSKDIGYQSTNAAEVTRMNTPIENIPMNVTVFNQQFIEDLLATDTSQLLAYDASSVKTTENDGFLARGSSSVGANFLNGFAQTSGFGSQPLANIERVEVIRGPAAVLYGSGGYGGTYNRITKQPQPKAFTAFRAIISDDHSFRAELDQNLGALPVFGGKMLSLRVNGILERGHSWFGQRKKEDAIAPTLAWQIGPRTKLITEYFFDWRETQSSWETPVRAGNPEGLSTGDGTFRVMPRRIAWIIPDDYRRNTRRVGSADLRHAFSDNLQFRSQFQYESKDQNNRETQALSDGLTILRDTALMPRLLRYQPRKTENYRTRNELIWNVATGPMKHRLLAGHGWLQQYDWNYSYRSSRTNGGAAAAVLSGDGRITDAQAGPLFNTFPNLSYSQFIANPAAAGFHPSLIMPINLFDRGAERLLAGNTSTPPLYYNTGAYTYLANVDLYANDVFSLVDDRVYVMAGVRRSQVVRKTINFLSGSFPNQTVNPNPATSYRSPSATTSSFGAVWHLTADKTFSVYANLNTSFSPQFNLQPDGSDLSPEEGKQKEVGLRFSLLKGRITGLVTYFDILQDNVTQADPAPGRNGYFIQLSGQRSTGYEMSINGRVTDQWLLMGGFSDTDARNDITGVAKDLSPRFRFTFFNRYNFTSGPLKSLGLSLGTIYTGTRDLTNSTSRGEPNWGPLPAWWRFDAIANYKIRPRGSRFAYDLSLKVNNVLNNTKIYYVGQWYRYTLDAGRDWQAVASVRF